jgi:hypothetical protein
MPTALQEQIEHLERRIKGDEHQLVVVQNKWQHAHNNAHKYHHEQKELEHAAVHAGKEHHPKLARKLTLEAQHHSARAFTAHRRALFFIDRTKDITADLHDLHETEDQKEKKQHEIEARGAHRVSKNLVEGGTPQARLALAMHLSEQHGSQFYSQTGTLDLTHGITGPSPGCRHDCSSWADSMFKAAGLEDMIRAHFAENVWTGNEGEHGEAITEAQLTWGCAIFFGTAPFHHIELKDGPMSEGPWTVGHGSSPIDRGTTTLLPGPRAFRRYIK